MEFHKPWYNEIICQFYASYHLDTREDTHVIHWTTEGKHYKVDFPTFAHLLGWGHRDRRSTTIAKSSDDMRASPVDCLREQYFCVVPEVPAICVRTFDSDLNGWIFL